MQKRIVIAMLMVALLSTSPTIVFATETPSPQSSPSATHTKQMSTQTQKDAISAARSVFAAARANAQIGFDRALADAQAIRDQAIAAAGTDANAIRAAKKDYRQSYKTIYRAYSTNLNNAKSILRSALASATAAKKG